MRIWLTVWFLMGWFLMGWASTQWCETSRRQNATRCVYLSMSARRVTPGDRVSFQTT